MDSTTSGEDIDILNQHSRDKRRTSGIRQPGARIALITLTAINFLNFADRYVPSAVKSLIQLDLGLNDFQTSLPSTGDESVCYCIYRWSV